MKWVQAENERMGYRDDSQWINPAAWQGVRVVEKIDGFPSERGWKIEFFQLHPSELVRVRTAKVYSSEAHAIKSMMGIIDPVNTPTVDFSSPDSKSTLPPSPARKPPVANPRNKK